MKDKILVRMILFCLIGFMLCLLGFAVAEAEELKDNFSITPIVGVYIPTGSEAILQNGIKYGVKGKYKAAVIKLQRIDSDVRYVGQRGIDLSFNTAMVGFEYEFKPTDFGVFGIGFSGGVAVPDYEEGYHSKDTHSEGLLRHTMKQADVNCKTYNSGANHFEKYRVDYSAAPVVEIELNYTKPFKHGAFFMNAGYTYLVVQENIRAIDEPNINGGWSIIDGLDCSGASFMVGYKISF